MVPVRGVAGRECFPAEPERQVGAGRDRDHCSEGYLNVAGACSVAAAGCSRSRWTMAAGSRAATTAEVDAALRQRELFGAAEYSLQHVGSDDRDDIDVG